MLRPWVHHFLLYTVQGLDQVTSGRGHSPTPRVPVSAPAFQLKGICLVQTLLMQFPSRQQCSPRPHFTFSRTGLGGPSSEKPFPSPPPANLCLLWESTPQLPGLSMPLNQALGLEPLSAPAGCESWHGRAWACCFHTALAQTHGFSKDQ